MRHKDENKNQAIFDSTIQLINEVGFADISMSKIAKRAKISAATIYVYYDSKEDLLVKLYLDVKEKLSRSMMYNIHEGMDSKEVCYIFMKNTLEFMIENKDWFLFLEQFSASPFMNRLCTDDTVPLFKPLLHYFELGISKGDLKQVKAELLISYCYFPIIQLAKGYHENMFTALEDEFETTLLLSWNAISQ
ncbi:TetR/AcrR family transcriptional regulator [Robertmurraya sp. P23]|uniref:TetR/AcrR family transcriptional regulator n=1 Tax=Robertmurraya sp. P23 TaxID=3436931 RepID=UPI003D997927